jgi:hypothetical protein
MNSTTVQLEAAQLGLLQRTQKYQDAAALKLIESLQPAGPSAPPSNVPPVEPVSAAPRDGGRIHVVA